MNENPQYTVLVPVALPSAGPGLVRAAAALTPPGRDPDICALHIEAVVTASTPARVRAEVAELRSEALGGAKREAAVLGLPIRTRATPSTDPAATIMDVAREEAADLIIIGWTKPVLGRSILSPTVNRLLEESPTDVAVLLDRHEPPWRHVLLPFEGGPHDELALEFVRRIANSGAAVTILSTSDPEHPVRETPRALAELVGPYGDERVTLKSVETWDPLGETVRESRRDYDLIVIGVTPTFGSGRSPFGREHERIARESDASLLIVRSHDVVAGIETVAAGEIVEAAAAD